MSLFQVIEIDGLWGVFAVNPNNPEDRELATVCGDRDYADMRAAALNRIVEIEPDNTASNVPEAKQEERRKQNFLFDSNGEPYRRKIRFED